MGNLEVPWCWRCRAFGTEEKYEDDKWPSWWILDANEKGQCRAVHCVKDDGLEIENWWTGYATVPSELLALCRVVSFRILSFSYSFNNYVSSLTVQFVQIWTAPSFAQYFEAAHWWLKFTSELAQQSVGWVQCTPSLHHNSSSLDGGGGWGHQFSKLHNHSHSDLKTQNIIWRLENWNPFLKLAD